MTRSIICILTLLASVSPAVAQDAPQPVAREAVQFIPRYDFHLSADHLSSSDPKFVWDTNFGGNLDIVDYGYGRLSFIANYEAVLGEELRNFDPNQGDYILDGALSLRSHGYEAAAVFHHTSRHLGDRFKRDPIDWNMFGGSVQRGLRRGRTEVHAQGRLLGALLKSNVDYNWESDAGVDMRVPLRSGVSLISAGNVVVFGVDGSRNRGTQRGGRAEAGLRFEGQRGAMEVFLAGERRLDAYPLSLSAMSWHSVGFRFVSR